MKLLGKYASNLNSFHYDALMALLQQAISVGDYGGGKTFNSQAATDLQQQGQDFSTLAIPEAGDRTTDEDFNHPLNLLDARFTALTNEAADFNSRAAVLIDMLRKDTSLIDQILVAAQTRIWCDSLPQLGNAQSFAWDFAGGYGAVSSDIALTDPQTATTYDTRPPCVSIFDCTSGTLHEGVAPANTARTFGIKRAAWDFSSTGETEALYGDDWAELTVLESAPRLTFNDHPTVSDPTVLNYVEVTGQVTGGVVPIAVNIQFVGRRRNMTAQMKQGDTLIISNYRVEPDEVDVVANGQTYGQDVDFTVDFNGNLKSISLPENTDLTIYLTEYFPAYQCSVNQVDWSPVFMLDPQRPYTDDETEFLPIAVQGDRFPITDEMGVPTGLYLRMTAAPPTELNFLVSTPAATAYGVPATLTVDLEHPAYMTGFRLSPFSSFPATLQKVECYGVTTDIVTLFSGSVLFDRKMTLSFPRTMVKTLKLYFVQENYTIKEHTVDPPDKLRRDTLNSLQSVLPFAVRRTAPTAPRIVRGAQYEFGFEDMSGEDLSLQLPTVFVTGAYRAKGIPEILRLDAVIRGSVDVYLNYIARNASGLVLDENLVGIQLTPGQAVVAPFSDLVDRSQIAKTDFYLKFVFRSADAMVERFNMQVACV